MATQLRIHGAVQGVGFRYALTAQAERLGLRGWVRNRRDGTVEAVVSGDAQSVERLIAWAHRGPPAAHVTRVEVSCADGEFDSFEQKPTA